MPSSSLKFVLAPWGSDSFGEDVWLIESALVFGIETIFEAMGISYADLYQQLGGDNKRSGAVIPYQESELAELASRAPEGTSAVIDGLISVVRHPESGVMQTAQFAPRTLRCPAGNFEIPDAFRYESFSEKKAIGALKIDDQEPWHALVIMVTESILEPFGEVVPANIGPETLKITESWDGYCAFLKGKRGARTVDEKLGYYKQAVRHDPHFYCAHFNAGQLFKQQQDYYSARREFLAAAESAAVTPEQLTDLYFELGLCSVFLGDTKTARNFWNRALAHSPSNPMLLVNIAGTYEQEEDWNTAIDLHQQAYDNDPTYYKAIVSLARLKAQLGKLDEAIPLYEKALDITPNDPLRHAILGGCYLAHGDELKARAYYEEASRLDPSGTHHDDASDESEGTPAPGDYARQELAKLNATDPSKKKTDHRGWRWFSR